MALSLVTRILLWILNIIESIPDQFVQRPILVREDNQSCINLTNNHSTSKYTRHIGICHHFLRDHYRGGSNLFKLVWTKFSIQNTGVECHLITIIRKTFVTYPDIFNRYLLKSNVFFVESQTSIGQLKVYTLNITKNKMKTLKINAKIVMTLVNECLMKSYRILHSILPYIHLYTVVYVKPTFSSTYQ